MNRKITLIAIVLLLAGAVAIAVMNSKKDDDSTAEGGQGKDSGSSRIVPGSGSADAGEGTKDAERNARESKDAELIAEYGGVRTALARKVSADVVSLLDDAVAMGDMMMSGAGQNFGGRRGMMRGDLGRIGIELNEEQQEKAMALFEAYQKRELSKSRNAVEALRTDSSALMELFLAGDAAKRGEMSEEDYAVVRDGAAEQLDGVINPLEMRNRWGGQPLQDDELMQGFGEILDEEQGVTFEAFMDERQAEAETKPQSSRRLDTNISGLPTMELDDLDGAVTGAKKVTSGFRSVLEGMGSLQDLQPKIEPQEEGGE